MKFIVLTKEQADNIKGKYGLYSALQPIKVYRSKYLMGVIVPFTEIEEYVLPLSVLEDKDLKHIKGFLNCFPIYDANYFQKIINEITGIEEKFIIKE